MPIDLRQVRRKDSGRFCGPKAAYLGELKHLFPDRVSRGLVIPFGAYYTHYQSTKVAVPDKLRAARTWRPQASRCRPSSSEPTSSSSA